MGKLNKPAQESYLIRIRRAEKTTAWLLGECVWRKNRICFLDEGRIRIPNARAFELANTCIASLPQGADELLPWREQRIAALKDAQFVSSIKMRHPFDRLLAFAKDGDPDSLDHLVQLAAPEATVSSGMKFCPSKELAVLGRPVRKRLSRLASNRKAPANVRRVAAMTLGASYYKRPISEFQSPSFDEEELRRSFYWGLKNGGEADAALLARIMKDREGLDFATRIRVAQSNTAHLSMPTELAIRLMHRGLSAIELVELYEGLAVLEPMYVEMYRHKFVDDSFSFGSFRSNIQEIAKQWKDLLFEMTLFTPKTRALVSFLSLSQHLFSEFGFNERTFDVIKNISNNTDMLPWVFASYLRILDLYSETIFSASAVQGKWNGIESCWQKKAWSVRKLMQESLEPVLVEQILAAEMLEAFAQHHWNDCSQLEQALWVCKRNPSAIKHLLLLNRVLADGVSSSELDPSLIESLYGDLDQ